MILSPEVDASEVTLIPAGLRDALSGFLHHAGSPFAFERQAASEEFQRLWKISQRLHGKQGRVFPGGFRRFTPLNYDLFRLGLGCFPGQR